MIENSKVENMIGKKYGRLTVIDQYFKRKGKEKRDFVKCICDCGNKCEKNGKNVRMGITSSCGCFFRDVIYATHHKENEYFFIDDTGYCKASNSDDVFIFDKEDYEKIKDLCWSVNPYGYAISTINKKDRKRIPCLKKDIRMANLILSNFSGKNVVDHIDRNRKNNKKDNLRICTQQQNNCNRRLLDSNNTGVTGVIKIKTGYSAYLKIKGVMALRKTFAELNDAIVARLKAEKEYFGEYAPQIHLFKEYGIE